MSADFIGQLINEKPIGMNSSELKAIWIETRGLLKLYFNDFRMLSTEKLTVLLAAVALVVVMLLLASCALLFLSIAIAQFLILAVGVHWGYLIMAVFYTIMAILVYMLRKPLIETPIARFLSHLFLEVPDQGDNNENV